MFTVFRLEKACPTFRGSIQDFHSNHITNLCLGDKPESLNAVCQPRLGAISENTVMPLHGITVFTDRLKTSLMS